MCMHINICMPIACGGHKGVQDPLKALLQMVACQYFGAGNKSRSSESARAAFRIWALYLWAQHFECLLFKLHFSI